MAYKGWIEFGGVELFNISRTTELARAMGIGALRTKPEPWISAVLTQTGYDDVANAPWYDPNYPASTEFAGLVPLDIGGIGDSSAEASPTEYITSGGSPGTLRNATQPLVFSAVLVAKTQRGAEYGKRWLDRTLKGSANQRSCSGSTLYYFRHGRPEFDQGVEVVHRRDVALTRGTSITRERSNSCYTLWTLTFTLTAHDPFEYGLPIPLFEGLGIAAGPSLIPSIGFGEGNFGLGAFGGSQVLDEGIITGKVHVDCPVYDYSPISDPLYPALVPPPSSPNLLPQGWMIEAGAPFTRIWAKTGPITPSLLAGVPVVKLSNAASQALRYTRISVYPASAVQTETNPTCDPIWSAVVSYLPPVTDFWIDAEQQAAYVWNGFGDEVRRADALVFSTDAGPVDWDSFRSEGEQGFLVTLDFFGVSGVSELSTRVDFSLVPRSD